MIAKDHIEIRRAMLADSEACAVVLNELGYPATSVFVYEKLKQLTGAGTLAAASCVRLKNTHRIPAAAGLRSPAANTGRMRVASAHKSATQRSHVAS